MPSQESLRSFNNMSNNYRGTQWENKVFIIWVEYQSLLDFTLRSIKLGGLGNLPSKPTTAAISNGFSIIIKEVSNLNFKLFLYVC